MRCAVELAARPEFAVHTVSCRDDHRGWSAPEVRTRHGLVLVRRGRFRRRAAGVSTDVDPTVGYVSLPGDEEHFAHPAGGDVCTSISLSPQLWQSLTHDRPPPNLYVDARLDLAHRRFLAASASGDVDYALAEQLLALVATALRRPETAGPGTDEARATTGLSRPGTASPGTDQALAATALSLPATASPGTDRALAVPALSSPETGSPGTYRALVSAAPSPETAGPGTDQALPSTALSRPATRGPRTDSVLVAQARAAIQADHPASSGLFPLAELLAVSPYRLSRAFSRELGISLTRYRNRVRVSRALDRLEDGEPDLAGLAADLGFADQAHLTRTVRTHCGHTPAALRRLLTGAP
ncbi:helix-turn-helix domain-containing protein [Amycolatopsis acidiphila]|uniref:helix-turn-helix domain-containing protein n=1 Tax=Amycolatopsis acidiphila TaxID=715473 RepID=UPI0019B30F48|nr:AraC family transcriptional regulator [Amycolatopsis acidiphila]UIJ61056.1 helix-turn-helix domain-containing protein [Amycolatopsis acidiphila]GHG99238.1 hypothetical protein GCM10017788_79700 [Amycolatopsis acidiphila]